MRSTVLMAFGMGVAATLSIAAPAHATTYAVYVAEASLGHAFNASNLGFIDVLGASDASLATFIYNGPLNFAAGATGTGNTSDITSAFFGANAQNIAYYGFGPSNPTTVAYGANGANFNSLQGFLATSGSASNYQYGSAYLFYSEAGSYGGTVLSILHDDGVSVYANGNTLTPVGHTTSGPTGAILDTVVLPTGTTSYEIAYARENGAPSVLQVSVPEPMSLALLGTGVAALGLVARRRRSSRVA